MNSERIKEIQKETAYPNSVSVQQALLQVWNECEQQNKNLYSEEEVNNSFKLVLQTNNIETLNVYADGKIEVNGVLTTDNDLIVETLKIIAKKQII